MSASALWRRSKSGTPTNASSAWIWRLTADWVRKSSAAARVKLALRDAASKTRYHAGAVFEPVAHTSQVDSNGAVPPKMVNAKL